MIQRQFFHITLILALALMMNIGISAADEPRVTVPVQGIHQRGCEAPKKDYDLITEYKRLPQYRYLAAYKRFPDYLYSFGIGKRFDDSIKRNSPYSFGVGKRNAFPRLYPVRLPLEYVPLDGKNYDSNLIIDDSGEIKRNSPSHAYGFGIGKRNLQLFNGDFDSDNRELSDDRKIADDGQLWDQF
ncbi:allatostatins [Fopius arisanus]|uniref:ALLS protein n=1 Tax=Fopius arisanus TaxID=64838 RepID=A0A0C9RII7_9HYME|nr:PREDICTED: allatostatins-like [Fopius arisanus]